MNHWLAELQQGLKSLNDSRAKLSAAMAQAAYDLRGTGNAPAAGLVEEMQRFRQEFLDLRRRFQEELGTAMTAEASHLLTVADLERAVENQAVRVQARKLVERVLQLKHVERTDFAPLVRCQADGQQLCQDLNDGQRPQGLSRAKSLLQEEDPLIAVWQLVSQGSQLDDDRWATLHERVSSAYGRELSTAIARNKLVVATATAD